MKLGGAIEEAKLDPMIEGLRLQFLELTAYARSDLLAWNPDTREFYTRNGGLYRLASSGTIEHVKGPSPDPEERL